MKENIRPLVYVLFSYISLWEVTAAAYRTFAPGIPDSGMVPVVLLPSLLVHYVFGIVVFTWMLSCLLFLVPAAIASFYFMQGARWATVIVGGFHALAVKLIWETRGIFFHETPYSTEAAILVTVNLFEIPGFMTLLGVVVGMAADHHMKKQNAVDLGGAA